MRSTPRMSITLPLEMANMVKSRVARGDFVSESKVLQEGLCALQKRENAVEHWLRTEVAAAYDTYKADPTRAKPLDEAWRDVETMMDAIDRELTR